MFVQGATPGRVEGWSYHEEDEDFIKGMFIPQRIYQCSAPFPSDATALDVWVLDQLKSPFHNATTNNELEAQLRAPQVIFFLCPQLVQLWLALSLHDGVLSSVETNTIKCH